MQLSSGNKIIAAIVVLLLIDYTIVALRCYSRRLRGSRWALDDWLVAVALVRMAQVSGGTMASRLTRACSGPIDFLDLLAHLWWVDFSANEVILDVDDVFQLLHPALSRPTRPMTDPAFPTSPTRASPAQRSASYLVDVCDGGRS